MAAFHLDRSLHGIRGAEFTHNLSEHERHRQLVDWNQTACEYPRDKCVHQLFEEQVSKTPDAVALIFEDQSLTYAQLNARANQLAQHLQSLGVGPEVLVGLCLERSLGTVVGLLGVLKAGGAYVPLDPGLPEERLRFLIADSRPATVLTSKIHAPLLERILSGISESEEHCTNEGHRFASRYCPLSLIEDISSFSPGGHAELQTLTEGEMWGSVSPSAGVQVNAMHPAYVNYTSGSTGEPRGVLIPHRAVVRLVKSANYVSLTPNDTLLHLSTLSFDASTFEIWGALLNGAKLVLMPPDQQSLTDIGNAIRRNHVTTLWLTAGLFHLMVDEQLDALRPLRQLLAGGDVLSVEHVIRAKRALPNCRLINGYGPTENTTFTCCYTVADESDLKPSVPIGRPISNTQVYLLDLSLQPVAVGVVGELYTGGDGLALGYLNAPKLTAERFIPNPFSDDPAARLYRTGDMARYRPDGNIEFLGRTDLQVKIRGFRIELCEIEQALRTLPSILDAVVLAQDNLGDDKRLVAYLILAKEMDRSASERDGPAGVSTKELRSQLSHKLPNYMIPSRFMLVSAFPLTPNGKLDRKALQSLAGAELASGIEHQSPRNELERQLTVIWKSVLKRDDVGIHDNFFELGGHSLLAVLVCARITQELSRDIALRLLFEHPTIADLAQQLQTVTDGVTTSCPIERIHRDQPLPTSFAQQRMWLLQQILPNPAAYNVPVAWRLTGHVDAPRLQRCLQHLILRHEVLRTSFAYRDAQLTQQIASATECELPWQQLDLRSPSKGLHSSESGESSRVWGMLKRHLQEEACRPFDLTQAPLWCAVWIAAAEEDHVLLLTFHHSIVDEWSLRIMAEELQLLYEMDGSTKVHQLPKLAIQYADYAVWERRRLTGHLLEKQQSYWTEQLQNLPESLELPVDLPRRRQPTGRGSVHEWELHESLVQQLRELARQEGTTHFNVLLAAFHVWLYRCTHQADIVVGTPITVRNRPEINAVFGFFLNTLPVRVRLKDAWTFRDTVRQVGETLIDAYSHADLPFEQILELAVHARHAGQNPLYQVMFVLLEQGMSALQLHETTAQPISVSTGTSKNDLTLSVLNIDGKWICQWEYSSDLFLPETVRRMSEQWTRMLSSVIENPQQQICHLELMTAIERHQLLVNWNKTAREYPRDRCVHQLFEEQVTRTPDAVAVVFEDQSMTYAELNARANQLALHLQSLGVGPEVLVGLYVERSLEMVVGMMGIVKAGGAYVPLDPGYPVDRLNFIVRDSGIRVLLSQRTVKHSLSTVDVKVLWLDEFSWQPEQQTPLFTTSPDALVYVIYTSGSTGQPKGVEIPHRALVNCVMHFRESLAIKSDDVWLAITTLSFDIAALEIWLPLLTGARCVVASSEIARDGVLLRHAMEQQGVTVLQATPATWKLMLLTGWIGNPRLQLVCGGESLPQELADQLSVLGAAAWNVYGPTEATIWATESRLKDHVPVTIGTPIANTSVYLLDANLHLVSQGYLGELCIGGDCLARGYRNRPELTSDRFIANPFSNDPGSRLYRTGDLARFREDGKIEFLGRMDHQVKIRGFRIELGEIEAALRAIPVVRDVVVLAKQDKTGDKRLVAYLVTSSNAAQAESDSAISDSLTVDSRTLRKRLASTLPDYMIPSEFIIVPEIPLTPNGKADRRALLSLSDEHLTKPDVGQDEKKPTAMEMQLLGIWQQIFQRCDIGREDNFFELGGHSLLAARLLSEIDKQHGCQLRIAEIFQSPTVESLALRIGDSNWIPRWTSLVPLQPRGDNPPLFCIHGRGGEVFGFVELARELSPEWPVYGLQAVWLDDKVPRHESVEQLARHYADEIRSFQPHGPYCLMGHSAGGWNAYAVAQDLIRRGEKVAFLGLLDTRHSADIGWSIYLRLLIPYLVSRIRAHLNTFINIPRGQRWRFLKQRLLWFIVRLPGAHKWLPALDQQPSMTESSAGEGSAARIPLIHVDDFDSMTIQYRPGPYSGDVTLFTAADAADYPHARFWKNFVRGRIQIQTVSGTHDSMINKDFVTGFTLSLKEHLVNAVKHEGSSTDQA